MQQALNEQAKIDQKLVFDYGLISQLNVEVVEVLGKNDYGFFNIRVKLTGDSESNHKNDKSLQERMAKVREITDFMLI